MTSVEERLSAVETRVVDTNDKINRIEHKLEDIDRFLREQLLDEIKEERSKRIYKIKSYSVIASLVMSSASIISVILLHIL